jgi:hypothetical protein
MTKALAEDVAVIASLQVNTQDNHPQALLLE